MPAAFISLEEASSHIVQACPAGTPSSPFFFVVGAGISSPPVPLAAEITEHCRAQARALSRSLDCEDESGLGQYSHWFQAAYPQPLQRQRFLRRLIEAKPISHANLRLAHLLLDKTITNLVVTTNFDDYLARALTLFGRTPIVCDHPSTVGRIDPEQPDIQIVHVHGSFWFYDCCNLKGELSQRAERQLSSSLTMASLLDRILANRSPVIMGYSGWEEDVFMAALRRRLAGTLPYNLYWFLYRSADVEVLPDWLRGHPQVRFVRGIEPKGLPQTTPAEVGSSSPEPVAAEPPGNSPAAILPAHIVLDKLIEAFALPAPKLTQDPLGFLSERLQKELLVEKSSSAFSDFYFLGSVIERIDQARAMSAQTVEDDIEGKVEAVRNALRRSMYAEVVIGAANIEPDKLNDEQAVQVLEALKTALVPSSKAVAVPGWAQVVSITDVLLSRGAVQHELHLAIALANWGEHLAKQGRSEEALVALRRLQAMLGAKTAETRAQVAEQLLNSRFWIRLADPELDVCALVADAAASDKALADAAAKAWVLVGKEHEKAGTWTGALEAFRAAIELIDKEKAPELLLQAQYGCATALFRLSRKEECTTLLEAITSERKGDAGLPGLPFRLAAQSWLARIHADGGNQERAVGIWKDLVSQYEGHSAEIAHRYVAEALLSVGYHLELLGRFEEAVKSVSSLIGFAQGKENEEQVLNSLVLALVNGAISNLHLGRRPQALDFAERAIKLHRVAQVQHLLNESVAYAILGNVVRARRIVERAKKGDIPSRTWEGFLKDVELLATAPDADGAWKEFATWATTLA